MVRDRAEGWIPSVEDIADPRIIRWFRRRFTPVYRGLARGGEAMTVEPHLTVFAGLKALEREGERSAVDAYAYESADAAFDAACGALKKILEEA